MLLEPEHQCRNQRMKHVSQEPTNAALWALFSSGFIYLCHLSAIADHQLLPLVLADISDSDHLESNLAYLKGLFQSLLSLMGSSNKLRVKLTAFLVIACPSLLHPLMPPLESECRCDTEAENICFI